MISRAIDRDGRFFAGYVNNTHYPFQKNKTLLYRGYGLLRVLGGGADWRIGGRVYEVREGDFVIMSEIAPRKLERIAGSFEYNIVHFDLGLIGHYTAYLPLFYYRSEKFSCVLRPPENEKKLWTELHDRIISEIDGGLPLGYELIENLTAALTGCFMREAAKSCPELLSGRGRFKYLSGCVAELVAYIENNPAGRLDTETLAGRVGLSASYLNLIFRRSTGKSPGEYVTERRAANVIRLLESRDITVLDAAYESGFETPSGFYKAFRRVTGMSPLEYMSEKRQ